MEIKNSIFWIKEGEIRQGGDIVLKNVNLHLEKGEFVYLIGRTGSGKSSLLKTLYGEIKLSSGTGMISDFDMQKIRRKDIPYLRRKLGIVFQDFQLLSDRNVVENLIFVMKSTGWKDKKAIQARAHEVLSLVGLDHKGHKMTQQLSGGEQQRVSIARSLVNKPEFILADEPTGNLDPETSKEIISVLLAIAKEGTSVLMATHDITIMEQFPARTIRVENETVKELNPMNEFDPFKQVSFE
ncbi:cell division ATP-binding protein FtsE [Crocinitomix catalasitica]|uniref:cell division ATP-binding protein FtsE n=1 Tax=Crocinitomix catalasitica TaxID=184607 RepID=UPI00055D9B1A|nr:ATP-binding cassette domain-containing protein [Crocinitomix catalasitica]